MGSTSDEIGRCRRHACVGTALWRGLCGQHWTRWQNGADLLDLPDDDSAAPPRKLWVAPLGPRSISLRTTPRTASPPTNAQPDT